MKRRGLIPFVPLSDSCLEELRIKDLQNKNDVRYEEFTSLGNTAREGGVHFPHINFKVMNYNVLSQTHLVTHIHHYQRSPWNCLNWEARKKLLREDFDNENADIICLQEVDEYHKVEILEPLREKGYDAIFVPRGEQLPDGCALLYRTSMFEIEDFVAVHYSKNEIQMLNCRPNVGMVARLGVRGHPKRSVVVANTHILFNPEKEFIKLAQLQILLAETERLAFNPVKNSQRYYPVILAGDFNVRPPSTLIRFLHYRFLDKNTRELPVEIPLESLNITHKCQYQDTVEERRRGLPDSRKAKDLQDVLKQLRVGPDLCPEEKFNPLNPTTAPTSDEARSGFWEQPSKNRGIPPGCISHVFNFTNVYYNEYLDYELQKQSRQQQDKKRFVFDYIFYSRDVGCLKPGGIRLLSRLRMPSLEEFKLRFPFLPNYASGSDHLPQIANFILHL